MSTSLVLTGPLDIYGAESTRSILLEALAASADLAVDLSAVTSCDLVGLQLLCATRRSAETRGGRFSISSESAVVTDACRALGVDVAALSSPARL